jgi:serine/threonine protein phosphatase 1
VLFLGDIVDRGPWSRQSVELVCQVLAKWPSSRLILGNHDAYFLEFMTATKSDERRFDNWLKQGGYQTLHSYGLLTAKSISLMGKTFRAMHPEHFKVLQETSGIVIDRNYAYTHAGVDPSRPVTDQDPRDLRLIRDGFLDYDGPLSHVVVHGHTPRRDCHPEIKANRIGIDTGAYASGRLTCFAVSEDEENLQLLVAQNVRGRIEIRKQDAAGLLQRAKDGRGHHDHIGTGISAV